MRLLRTILHRFAAAALIAALALAGCSKDDAVAPCGKEDREAGDAKLLTGTSVETPQHVGSARKPVKDAEPVGISDDGDDVGDGERNKKTKKRPAN